ncbi:MAG: hypothetical protein SynsKO_20410 [Synoicihabitans sp.]
MVNHWITPGALTPVNSIAPAVQSNFADSLALEVSFVIPVFNQLAHSQACRRALEAHVPQDISHQIIWVDDGSDAETRKFLAELKPPHHVVTLRENRGFAHATNAGAGAATGKWLCLLNNDVEVTAGAIGELLRVAGIHRDAGVVGNVQIATASGEVDHAGITFVDGGYPIHYRESLESLESGPSHAEAVAVTAACCLVDRAWFQAIGGLDTAYRNGFEDVDLCMRAREAGWKIYVARHSVVKHAVSTSQGRGRYEYRNAEKFLQRWGERTKLLGEAETLEKARRHQVERARASTSKIEAVQNAYNAILRRDADRQTQLTRPAKVWVDLLRMEPRGANGGIKPLVYGFLEEMTQLAWQPLDFVVLAQVGLENELSFLRESDVIALRSGAGWRVTSYPGSDSTEIKREQLKERYPPEVLYCPFGTSEFAQADLPSVALLVDSLHRDLPSALPIEEVNFRDDTFKRAIGSSDWIQTLAKHGINRLRHHFGVSPSRCFHTYASVQQRLADPDASTERPDSLPTRPFFFYPANFWPHKNHEVLLTAYYQYQHKAGEECWQLLLTGHPDKRMESLQKFSSALGMDNHVIFGGHLPDDAFKSVWQHAGALVFPSLHEGFGIPVAEAFQSQLPVIAANASALPEVGHDACEWFDPHDPSDLARCLQTVAQDESRRAELAQRGAAQLVRFSRHYEASKLNHFLFAAARNLVP